MHTSLSQTIVRTAAMSGVALLLVTGCNKKADNTINYKSAINSYYSMHPVCLFPEAVKFPVQAATSDASKTAPYDALVDQGLLVRTMTCRTKGGRRGRRIRRSRDMATSAMGIAA
jgi:hypothetical protein